MQIMTVLGPISPDELGVTAAHEHLILDSYYVSGDAFLAWTGCMADGLLIDEALIIDELAYFQKAGGRSVVEVTTPDLRRNPQGLKRIAEATGLNVIMGCGWYRGPFLPERIERANANELAAEIVRDLTEGADDTGIRAGIIGEIGADKDYISPAEERVFRAAARAHNQTGAAITTHAFLYPVGLDQLDILQEEGADLRRVIVGHCDTYLSLDYHEAIVKRGAYVQYDDIGKRYHCPDERRIAALIELLRRGYESQILLSSDVCLRSHLHLNGGIGYDHVLAKFLPALREAGVSEEQIEMMTVENPKRVLAF